MNKTLVVVFICCAFLLLNAQAGRVMGHHDQLRSRARGLTQEQRDQCRSSCAEKCGGPEDFNCYKPCVRTCVHDAVGAAS